MKMIEPGGIPRFTGDFEQLDKDVSGLRGDATGIRGGGADVHSRFQMLGAYYTAPEADDLFATTQPVMDKADEFAADLETVADALETFSIEARPLAKRLERLRGEAGEFVDSVEGDDDWTYDGDKTDRNNELMDGVAEAESAFRAAERQAASKISAIVRGPRFIEDDGSHKSNKKTVMYGFDADHLKEAKELPWGSYVSESIHAWEIHRHIKHYVWDGFVVDGAVGTLKGLGPLVGIGGSAKDAWSNLGDVVSGIGQYTMTPIDWALDHTIGPDDSSGDNKQKAAAREFGKSLVAWDQWDENPVQAAGTTTFNVLTLGAGPLGAIAKGGKGGAAAKAAGVGAKIGTYADPLSAGLTVGGKAISKLPSVADLTARVRTGTDATPDLQRVHSDLEFDGSRVRVEDGEFIRVDADGRRIEDTAPEELSAAERASEGSPGQREPALMGAGARGPEGAAAAGKNVPPEAGHGGSPHSTSGDDLTRGSSGGSQPPSGRGAGAGNGLPDDFGRVGDGAATPGSQADNGAGAADDGQPSARERTPEEQKKVIAEQIKKANDPDQTWFEKNYRSDGHRKSIKTLDENGDELPILAKDSDGNWIAKDSLPPKPGAKSTLDPKSPFTRDSVPDGEMGHLDEAASNRKVSNALTNAERAFKEDPSAKYLAELNKAQAAFDAQMPGRPNNSSIAEALGEQAAMRHVIPKAFTDAQWIDLPKTPNGANMFDQLYRLDDGTLVIAEAKAPKANPIWRKGAGDAEGWMVQQGTRPYIETILFQMERNSGLIARDSAGNVVRDSAGNPVTNLDIANEISDALEAGKLKYVMVKATENPGTYAGAKMEHFDIG
ncbi:hypothetical protein [Streptomyces sp. NPDC087300]|uniref:hypothetical protein n=1 Tax=Streptomyces sp. NPDC087300 TaxID=3365780 RepID=UPI0038233EED